MAVGNLKIKITDAGGTQAFPAPKSTATIGSASHCDVIVSHPSVQPEHLRAWLEGGRIWVQDLGGPTGTSINGIRLPALKPMLVREVDVLRLGECPATIGFETGVIRAPVVQPVDLSENTSSGARAKLQGEDEANLGRELAQAKLDLQVAKLDREAGEELRQRFETLEREYRSADEECRRLGEELARVAEERRTLDRRREDEVGEAKRQGLREVKEQRERAERDWASWKTACAERLMREVRKLNARKAKAWVTRPFSKDMMLEWESELDQLLKADLLGLPATPTPAVPPATPEVAAIQVGGERATVIAKPRAKSTKTRSSGPLLGVIGASLMAFAALIIFASFKMKSGARRIASTAAPVVAPVAQTAAPKDSYTDNVLYTQGYARAEQRLDYRALWMKELRQVARQEWKLDERTTALIVGSEMQMLQDLITLRSSMNPEVEREGIARMRSRESRFVKELQVRLGKHGSTERFLAAKRGFIARNPVYLRSENR